MIYNFVIFGASGDLAKNYLFPALLNLQKDGHQFKYFGFGRSPFSSDFLEYIQGSYDLAGISQLKKHINSDTIFYLAIPTEINLVKNIINALKTLDLISPQTRLVLEKPFGSDLTSATMLMNYFVDMNLESNVFLVDHYLTKNLVKNIISLRFANSIFADLWNNKYISEINFIIAESRSLASRGGYYDKTGEIRDMVQNHLLQLLTLVTMDSPDSFDHQEFINKKMAILKSITVDEASIEIGQYDGYLKEVGVGPDSQTETLAKMTFNINSPQWSGVPFNISTGKKLDQTLSEINVIFKPLNDCLWGEDCQNLIPNQLTITLKPKNDIVLTLNSSFSPHKIMPQPITLNLGSLDISSSAYENVILDVIDNIKYNTPSFAEILVQWQIIDKILNLPHLRDKLFCY
jgi:glucose-6-phosphate 1-dehydrogenase